MDIDQDKLMKECVFTATRSSGSGGQNVNKVSSKVLLSFDVNMSDALDDDQKQLKNGFDPGVLTFDWHTICKSIDTSFIYY
ncbi:MAG: hypothetical protein LLF80_09740 [Porphyromonadaceae bacterium]|nr:hypothetical protein [Porphyromonadaceae bacterium]